MKETDAEITYETVDTTDPWYRGEEYAKYHQQGTYARLRNGKITAELNPEGWLRFLNQKGEELTAEFWRNRNRLNRYALPLNLKGRELKPIMSTNEVELTARFEAYDDEKIFGMGQYQQRQSEPKRARRWNWRSETVRPASHLWCPAGAMAFCGITPPSAQRDLWHEHDGMARANAP